MVACPWPATMQSRSRVCPSVTEDAEDSMRMGGVTPVAVRAELRVNVPTGPRHRWGPVPRRVALTVRWVGSVIDGDDEGRLLRDAARCHPAHVLP